MLILKPKLGGKAISIRVMTHNTVESIREEPNDDFLRKLGVALDECTGVANSGLSGTSLSDTGYTDKEDLSSLSESADEEESMGCWAPRSKKVVVCKPVQLKRVCIFGIHAVRCHTSI